MLEEEALTEQGQFGGAVDLWGREREGVRPTMSAQPCLKPPPTLTSK